MQLTTADAAGIRFVEGPPDQPLMRCPADADLVLEACFSSGAASARLYAQNLTEGFFDLSSGEASAVLQKLRNYGIRLAVVCAPDSVRFSSRFGEVAAEENRGDHLQLCESRDAALEWLAQQRK